jgi:hypothetical protein
MVTKKYLQIFVQKIRIIQNYLILILICFVFLKSFKVYNSHIKQYKSFKILTKFSSNEHKNGYRTLSKKFKGHTKKSDHNFVSFKLKLIFFIKL